MTVQLSQGGTVCQIWLACLVTQRCRNVQQHHHHFVHICSVRHVSQLKVSFHVNATWCGLPILMLVDLQLTHFRCFLRSC